MLALLPRRRIERLICMRLMPRLASDIATSFSPILKKAISCRTLLSGSLRKAADPISPTAPLLHLGELSSGRDNFRLPFSRRIELFEIGDDIVICLGSFKPGKVILVPGILAFGSLMYSRKVASSQVIPEFLFAEE